MVGADGEGVRRRRPRLDLLVQAMGEDPVRETLDVSGEDWELILSGGMELDETLLARLETMIAAMGQAVEWWDEEEDEEDEGDEGEGASEDVGGVELDERSERPSEEVPAEALSSRSWNWGEHLEERRASLRAMHHLAMVTQYRLGVRYQGQLAMMGLVAKIELALIFMGETLPDPGVDWDGDRRLREINRRVSRLLWVKQEQDREFGGVRGVFNWLSGRTRLSSKELVKQMLEEADDIMEVMPEVMVGKTGMISLAAGVTAGIGRLMNTLRRSRLLMMAGRGGEGRGQLAGLSVFRSRRPSVPVSLGNYILV